MFQFRRNFYYWAPYLLLILLIVIEWLRILNLNHNIFSYTLDDPYIHLSLAKQIASGGYGLNSGEYSSPSSSILWPFLLAPFSSLFYFEFIPLFLNSLLSILTLSVFISLCLSVDPQSTKIQWKHLLLFCLLVPALNLASLIFSGMEYSLQMLFSVLLIYGIIIESRFQYVPLWLSVIIVAGPLVRYENLALSVPALIFLFFRGHIKRALYTAFFMCAFLGLFSLFLFHIGQPLLPSSALNRVGFDPNSTLGELLISQLKFNLIQRQGQFFCILLLIFITVIFFSKLTLVKKQLLAVITASLLLHLFFGKFNFHRHELHRYELYLTSAILLIIYYLYFDSYYRVKHSTFLYFILLIGLIGGSYPYFIELKNVPYAANNIYRQQYQMRKVIVNWVKSPVAVNDIGWVSFNNPYYVLDLFGLGNYDIYKKIRLEKNPLWMIEATQKAQAKLVMLYPEWFFAIPKKWTYLGCLNFEGPRISESSKVVYFYATDKKYVPELKQDLLQFKQELPQGNYFKFNCYSH